MSLLFHRTVYTLAMVFFLLTSCSPEAPRLEGFNADAWKSDRNGCKGERLLQQAVLESQKSSLLAQPEAGILTTLGRPDQVELYKRNQKLYHYYLSGHASCESKSSKPIDLMIRFNAMGRAKEITITK